MAAWLLGKENAEFSPGLNRHGFYRVTYRSRTAWHLLQQGSKNNNNGIPIILG